MADALLTQSPCVIVLGMHRSGTSLLTGSLEAAGLYLGEVNNEAPFNRKGNKENESIRELNDALLERNGAAWNRPPNGQAQWSGADEEGSRSLISPYLAAKRPWGFKDPRTVWTVEGWLRLLPHARPVGVFRHPSLVVQSLTARSGELAVDADEALRLWCAYNSELIRLQRKYRFPNASFRIGKCVSGRLRHPVDYICAFDWSERPGGFLLRRRAAPSTDTGADSDRRSLEDI